VTRVELEACPLDRRLTAPVLGLNEQDIHRAAGGSSLIMTCRESVTAGALAVRAWKAGGARREGVLMAGIPNETAATS
jgi:hypothetical protein